MLSPCLQVNALGDAAANIRCLCFLEELPDIPGRTIQAGNRAHAASSREEVNSARMSPIR